MDDMNLPVPPARLCQVVRATRDPDVPMGKVVRLISSDPGMSVELLRIANSAYYSPRRRIRSVAQATVFLGLRAVRNHAVSHVLKSVIAQVDLSQIDERRLWRDILFRGAAAHVLAAASGYEDPTEAFTTGVVMDAGLVMLVAHRPDQARALEAAAHRPEAERLAMERALTGSPWTLASVQAAASQLQHDVTPIDDLRGTAAYRRLLARNLLIGFFLDSQRPAASGLEDTPTATVTAGGHP